MILSRAQAQIEQDIDGMEILRGIERAGRTCYKSEDKITDESAAKFVASIIKSGHDSVIEHRSVTARVICDRGITHELVRHRLASFSQESTRYCNYKGGVEFIIPNWLEIDDGEWTYDSELPFDEESAEWCWYMACLDTESYYLNLIEKGWKPQQARSVLPNSLKTEIVVTANLRQWRHIFRLRALNKRAHTQIREVMYPLLCEMRGKIPVVFDDLETEEVVA